jgi:hypothetical protein
VTRLANGAGQGIDREPAEALAEDDKPVAIRFEMKKTRGACQLDGSLLPLSRRTARMPCTGCFRDVA